MLVQEVLGLCSGAVWDLQSRNEGHPRALTYFLKEYSSWSKKSCQTVMLFSTWLRPLTWWLIRCLFPFRFLLSLKSAVPVAPWCVTKQTKGRMKVEGPKTMPKRTPSKAVHENVSTPPQERQMWLDQPHLSQYKGIGPRTRCQ